MFHWSRSNLEMDFFCCRLARKPTHGTNQETEGEALGGSTGYNCTCKYGQHKTMIIWQFSHTMQTVLVMAKWIIADCMTSSGLWVNLRSPCKHESELLSRCFKCPPCACRITSKSKRCKSVAAVFTDVGGMAFHRLAEFLSPAVTNWIWRVFGETIISVIFARAIAMWPSHLIEWSPERLASHSVQSNS